MKPVPVRLLLVIFLMLAGVSRADVVVMKNGDRYVTDKAFHSAGATYFNRDGSLTSVPDADVERIEPGSFMPAATPKPFKPNASATARLLSKAKGAIEKSDVEFIRECRNSIEADARLSKSDYKATCGKALVMVERMYDGTMPGDGTFGYYLEVLNNPIMWEILPAGKSTKLKDTIFKKDGPVDKFNKAYQARVKEAALKAALQQEDTIKAQKALQARLAKLKANARLQAPAKASRATQNRARSTPTNTARRTTTQR